MMLVQMTLLGYKNVLHVYLPLSSSPGMTISCLCHDAKRGGRGGGGPRFNVIMTLICLEASLIMSESDLLDTVQQMLECMQP